MKHEDSKKMNFDFFYMAQIVWDECMSKYVDDFLKSKAFRDKRPGDNTCRQRTSGFWFRYP